MESASFGRPGTFAAAPGKGLKRGAIGYISNLVIAVASTAPAYSLAATLGLIVAVKGIGTSSPAVLLVSFIPMLCIAAAYRYMTQVVTLAVFAVVALVKVYANNPHGS